MVERTVQVEHYSPPAGKVQRPWVFKKLWTLPYKGADYSAVLALVKEQPVYVYWTEADWLPLCKSVGERELLAHLIHAEAAGEGRSGWIAVANSVVNRVNSPDYPNTTCGVIFEIRTPGVPQYCGVLSKHFLKFDSEQVRQEIYEIAGRALDGTLEDITEGFTSFYNPALVNSKWHESLPVQERMSTWSR